MIRRAFMATIRKLKFVVEEVFSTQTYSGNSSTNSINAGIDMTKGGMIWTKTRSAYNNPVAVFDTARGNTKSLFISQANSEYTFSDAITGFTNTGFTLSTDSTWQVANSNSTYAAWVFRKAAKFFDVKTFTATNGLVVNHDLGVTPGLVIIKRTNASGSWYVFHRDMSTFGTQYLVMNDTSTYTNNGTAFTATATALTITVGGAILNGGQYVAYMFGHDTTSEGVVRCGKYTGTSTKFDQTYYSNTSITIPTGVSSVKVTIKGGDGSHIYNAGNADAAYNGVWFNFSNDYGTNSYNSIYFIGGTQSDIFNWPQQYNPYGSGGYTQTTVHYYTSSSSYISGSSNNPHTVPSNAYYYYVEHKFIPNGGSYEGKIAYSQTSSTRVFPPVAPYYDDSSGTDSQATLNGLTQTASAGYGSSSGTTSVFNMFKPIDSSANLSMTVGSSNGYVRVEYYYNGTSTVNLGWEPQWLLIRSVTTPGDWNIIDNVRGSDYPLYPNLSSIEPTTYDAIDFSSTGFTTRAGALSRMDDDYIYVAIRKGPMR